jgi:uncharacterized membrane protein
MPGQDTPDILDTLTAASLQSRREKLTRRLRIQKILVHIVFGLSACEALFALAAYLNGDYSAARFCAVTGCIVFAFAYIAQVAARTKAVDALREMDRST